MRQRAGTVVLVPRPNRDELNSMKTEYAVLSIDRLTKELETASVDSYSRCLMSRKALPARGT
jgi:hypothetical protein